MSNTHDESHINVSDDRLANSLSSRIEPFRSLSARRLRDPSHRKNVSFNDVPIVHEVPSYDTMRNSNSDLYRSWTCADATLPLSSQTLLPFNSTSATVQKLNAHRLSSNLYSSTNNTTLNRLSDGPIRIKAMKNFEDTTEHHTISTPPPIIIRKFDEQTISSENNEEKKHLYRSPIIPDYEHHRILPFTYVPLSESTNIYTSMLTTNFIQSNDQNSNERTRTIRALSASLPITLTNSSTRNNDNVSITPLRITTNTLSNNSSSRTVLKPATIAFHSSTNSSTILPSTTKPPAIPPRSSSFTAHSRLVSSSNRPLSSTPKHTIPSTTLSRSRSANISSSKRNTASPTVMLDGQSGGIHHNNLYTTAKRNPNIRQTYSSYIHHVLLPTNIN